MQSHTGQSDWQAFMLSFFIQTSMPMAALACLHHVCSVTVGYLSGSVGITLQASVQFPWFTLLIVVLLNVRLILFSAAWLIRQNRIVLSLDKVIWSEQIAPVCDQRFCNVTR